MQMEKQWNRTMKERNRERRAKGYTTMRQNGRTERESESVWESESRKRDKITSFIYTCKFTLVNCEFTPANCEFTLANSKFTFSNCEFTLVHLHL